MHINADWAVQCPRVLGRSTAYCVVSLKHNVQTDARRCASVCIHGHFRIDSAIFTSRVQVHTRLHAVPWCSLRVRNNCGVLHASGAEV